MKMTPIRIIFLLILTIIDHNNRVEARAFFVFGDSLVDNGNNNYLPSTARADSPPYGIDFPTHQPTGRFSNGLNIGDIISETMGWEFTLPNLSPDLKGQKLLVGANFASAGVGILNDTGAQFVNIIGIYEQLDNFKDYQKNLSAMIGKDKAKSLVAGSLVLFTLGGNDFVNNYYFMPYSRRSQEYTIEEYVPFLISEYKKILQRLYDLGPRKVLVTETGALGCVPAELALHSSNGECADMLENAGKMFNVQLNKMLDDLNKEVGSTVFVSANTNRMHSDLLTNPQAYGFKNSKDACCGQGPYNGLGLCTPFSNLCPNRNEYVFWDAFHPTEKANRIIVKNFFIGSNIYMHPMNLNALLALDSRA